jgi:camphor 5-monooxygenase
VLSRGACNFTAEYAEQFPIRIFLAMVNLPIADAPKLKHLSDQIIRPNGSTSCAEIMRALADYLAPHIDARRANTGEDLLSHLANTKVEGRALGFDEAINAISQVLVAGLDKIVNFLRFPSTHLARSTEDRRTLLAIRDLIPKAVQEFMRRFGLVTVARLVTRDATLNGVQLRKDDLTLVRIRPSLI